MNIELRGECFHCLGRFALRHTHFLSVGHDGVVPVTFAEQMKHQIPLGFSHANLIECVRDSKNFTAKPPGCNPLAAEDTEILEPI